MEVREPPYPEYREQQLAFACRDYRVVFWEHQLPPENSGVAPEEMAWAEFTVDLVGAADVQEAIEWAESHIDEYPDRDSREPHGERLYVLYVKMPREERYVQLAGFDPVRSPDDSPESNLRRRPL